MAITNVMLPIIKKVMPSLIAQQIIGVQPMTGPTGSIFTTRIWNTRKYNKRYWPYQYNVVGDYNKAEQWCWQQLKGRHWHSTHNKFVFKRKEDAAVFALRWDHACIK